MEVFLFISSDTLASCCLLSLDALDIYPDQSVYLQIFSLFCRDLQLDYHPHRLLLGLYCYFLPLLSRSFRPRYLKRPTFASALDQSLGYPSLRNSSPDNSTQHASYVICLCSSKLLQAFFFVIFQVQAIDTSPFKSMLVLTFSYNNYFSLLIESIP